MTTTFREKAREVKAEGVAERGNFEPHGKPKAMYDYWLKHTDSKKGNLIKYGDRQENFCHFWRVVAIWAPLMFLFRGLEKAMPVIAGFAVIAAVAALVCLFIFVDGALPIVSQVIGFFSLIIYGVVGFLVGNYTGAEGWVQDREDEDYMIQRVAFWVTFPVAIPFYFIAKAFTWEQKHFSQHNAKVGIALMTIAVLTVLGFVWADVGSAEFFKGVAVAGGVLVALGLALAAVFFAADYISGMRKIKKDKARAAALEVDHREVTSVAVRKPRKPSKIGAFFAGMGDFIVFFAQVVRVKKWKICPLVTVDNGRD